jgi:hypothetical protein
MTTGVSETGPGSNLTGKHGRRDFLKKSAIAGATLVYAAPVIETLRASSVSATSGPPSGGNVCSITKGGINNLANNFCTDLLAFYHSALAIFPGLATVSNDYPTTMGSNPSCSTIQGFVSANNANSCPQVEKMVTLAILVGANVQYALYASSGGTQGVNPGPVASGGPGAPCAAGLDGSVCISVPSDCAATFFSGNTSPTLTVFLTACFSKASGSGNNTLCASAACLDTLLDALAVDQSGLGGSFISCAA